MVYFSYKKVLNYIFFNSESSEEIFRSIKEKKSPSHLFLYIGISFIIISVLGFVFTFRKFSSEKGKFKSRKKKESHFEDLYS